jgi:uncharacterized membrane protein YphA (DoxX/SURF4 family)
MATWKTLDWVLRIGLAATFFGHGWVAFSGNATWIGYLTCVGFEQATAEFLLPHIGILDGLVAAMLLFKPNKALFFWALGWLILIAAIRPLCGESWIELVKRGGYIACAMGLILLRKNINYKNVNNIKK